MEKRRLFHKSIFGFPALFIANRKSKAKMFRHSWFSLGNFIVTGVWLEK